MRQGADELAPSWHLLTISSVPRSVRSSVHRRADGRHLLPISSLAQAEMFQGDDGQRQRQPMRSRTRADRRLIVDASAATLEPIVDASRC
jgi:hypothetical protein